MSRRTWGWIAAAFAACAASAWAGAQAPADRGDHEAPEWARPEAVLADLQRARGEVERFTARILYNRDTGMDSTLTYEGSVQWMTERRQGPRLMWVQGESRDAVDRYVSNHTERNGLVERLWHTPDRIVITEERDRYVEVDKPVAGPADWDMATFLLEPFRVDLLQGHFLVEVVCVAGHSYRDTGTTSGEDHPVIGNVPDGSQQDVPEGQEQQNAPDPSTMGGGRGPQQGNADLTTLILHPQDDAARHAFRRVELRFDAATGIPMHVEAILANGRTRMIDVSDVQTGASFDEAMFEPDTQGYERFSGQ